MRGAGFGGSVQPHLLPSPLWLASFLLLSEHTYLFLPTSSCLLFPSSQSLHLTLAADFVRFSLHMAKYGHIAAPSWYKLWKDWLEVSASQFPNPGRDSLMCCIWLQWRVKDFPGGAAVKNLPANAGNTGLMPGQGRSHMPRSNKPMCHNYWACTLEPTSHNYWSPHA